MLRYFRGFSSTLHPFVLIFPQQFPALKKRRGFRGRLQEAFVTREPRLVFTHEDNPGIITNS